jgi:hypothetical protein
MTTIQTTADVGPDRQLTVQLPPEVPTGRHRVVLLLLDDGCEAVADSSEAAPEDFLQWENGLLVYTGPIPTDLDICRQIELVREERMHQIMLAGNE